MNDFQENELIEISMQIILHAGNAKINIAEALTDAKQFKFESAIEKLVEAESEITLAHKAQTEVIQNEASGSTYQFTLLFVHAQDTLMTTQSEFRMSKEMIDILKMIEKR